LATASSIVLNNTVYINKNTNRVGINNANPQYNLDVNGTINSKSTIFADTVSSLRANFSSINRDTIVGGSNLISTVRGLGSAGYVSSFNNVSSISSQRFVASSIGVGCNLPRYNLDVNGSINASQDIRVNNIPISVGSTPVGSITMYASPLAPTNWLICNGQSLLKASYLDLWNVIFYVFGGSGANFNVPNLGGRVPVGSGSSGGSNYLLTDTGGEETHTLTAAEMPSHSHNTAWVGFGGNNAVGVIGGSAYSALATTSAGGDLPHNNMQPYIVLNYIIRAFP
jgi:hypothetical protein